ncbi:putative endonuclease [Ensifer adhaerens]|uniref:Endonuclease n=1 Tax=Ensifer adhaerens TaxID=106592 RepID=A0ACC5SQU8_ENSAD|nr:YraN family protein [Ensifer adhaerens]MBP1871160.1 putative endonuclease [Ensifer adhaerens]|eukprot:gene2415-biopygen2032
MATDGPDRRKLQAQRRGRFAEYRAALCLIVKGYRIVAMRHRTRLGEIDIIARRGDLIACVEVKARRSADDGVFAVTATAQHRIRAASDLWLARQPDFSRLSVRYDIITVTPWRWPRHLPDAF